VSEKQAQAKQAELAREKQHQDALDSDTVAVAPIGELDCFHSQPSGRTASHRGLPILSIHSIMMALLAGGER
jgi:hypothetical protein